MSKKQPISFFVNDVSALAQSLVKQITNSNEELGQSRMLNYLAKAAGYANWHQYKSNPPKGIEVNTVPVDVQQPLTLDDRYNLAMRNMTDEIKKNNSRTPHEKAQEFAQKNCQKELLAYKLNTLKVAFNKTHKDIGEDIGYSSVAVRRIFLNTDQNPYATSKVVKAFLYGYNISSDWFFGHEGSAPDCLSVDAISSIEEKITELKTLYIELYEKELKKHKAMDSMVTAKQLDFS